MRDFDLTPLLRSFIGFDRMMDLLESAQSAMSSGGYPPYNIEQTGENAWRVEIAVAGFAPDELTVTQQQNLLVVAGAKKEDASGTYLYRGIPAQSFERRFELADFVEVKGARFADGLLLVELGREIPEELRPRRIEIASGAPTAVPGKETPRLARAA